MSPNIISVDQFSSFNSAYVYQIGGGQITCPTRAVNVGVLISASQSRFRHRNSSRGYVNTLYQNKFVAGGASPGRSATRRKYRHHSTFTLLFAFLLSVFSSIVTFCAPANATKLPSPTQRPQRHTQERGIWRRKLYQLEFEHANQD